MTDSGGGYTNLPNSFIDDQELTGSEKLVMLSLYRFYNTAQRRAWPSIQTIADCARLKRTWTIETLKSLEQKGYIRTEKSAGKNTHYEILTRPLSRPVQSVDRSSDCTTPVQSVDQYPSSECTPPVQSVNPTNTNTNTNRQLLETNTKTPAKIAPKNESNFEADFEDFWEAYPKPKNPDKTPGRQKYIALRKKGVSADDLLRAAQNYAQAMRGTDPRYIKHCKTFLGPSDAWRDYLNEPAQTSDELPDAAELFPDLAEWMRRNRGVANGE